MLKKLRETCARLAGDSNSRMFDQATVSCYSLKEAGIGPHIDSVRLYGPVILGISLGSAVDLVFERIGHQPVRVRLEPRSLMVLKGEARYQWKHRIKRTPQPPRVSITFRSVNHARIAEPVAQ
jgi:alkylated DNA repair dioxygenase AlkB